MTVVVSIRRYPVKSMGGEALESVEIDARGLVGDRAYAVRDMDSRLAAGKNTPRHVRRDGVFEFTAATHPEGVVVTGPGARHGLVGEPEVDAWLSDALVADVAIAPETDVKHFDDGAVSLIGTATLEWCERELSVDADARRLRANLVVETEEPFEEEAWVGDVRIGSAVFRTAGRIERCRTIDLAQDGVDTETRWLKKLGQERDLRVAVYLEVVTPGWLSVGDEVRA